MRKEDLNKKEKLDETASKASEGTNSSIIDIKKMRKSQDFLEVGVKKLTTNIPVRKPNKQEFLRVNADENFRLDYYILELKEEGESYLIEPSLVNELSVEIVRKRLLIAINRQGVLFVWPIKLHDSVGKIDEWNRSALEASQIAEKKWIRLVSNRSLGSYEIYVAQGDIPEPEFPSDLNFEGILNIAFKDRYITSMDDEVVKRLKGKI
tara:strand:- start:139 stop:762 length:624 start_codon:yes stop_codon:yes gene_type:complete